MRKIKCPFCNGLKSYEFRCDNNICPTESKIKLSKNNCEVRKSNTSSYLNPCSCHATCPQCNGTGEADWIDEFCIDIDDSILYIKEKFNLYKEQIEMGMKK